jgi:hypothetical protein
MSNEIYTRGILQLAIERFDYPENISLVGDPHWPDLEIKDKSVIAKFLVNGDLVTVEFFVWSQYSITTGTQHAKTIYPTCFGIFEAFRVNKAKELVKLEEVKRVEKARKKIKVNFNAREVAYI